MKACSVRVSIPPTGQGVARSVALHVRVDRDWRLSGHAKPFYQLLGAIDGQRRLPLRQEYEVCVGMLAPPLTKSTGPLLSTVVKDLGNLPS
jgi:hypothetical protein